MRRPAGTRTRRGPLPVGDTRISPVCPDLPAAGAVPGWLLQSTRLSRSLLFAAGSLGGEALSKIVDFYPKDSNALQTFSLPDVKVDQLKVTFEDTTDFFGRVVIYHLRVLGEKA
ncbi:nuclear receptor 2C2-associated protein isoform X3 [Nannospalax galili]|uniref:nuclear receptor 2C2-associated protein isoform X3 n=1 Tax=Nannospalax galili TaxID=1026970 RepID=UPI00111C908E|nr:nuclear receptor 2C2-associated protein isoform X3 [Nannospalax galili]